MKTIVATLILMMSQVGFANAAEGQIVLQYSADSKQYVLENDYLVESDFSGSEVILGARTRQDVSLLVYLDTAPENLCYRGNVYAAKEVLETIIYNTDGNGDTSLESSNVQVKEKVILAEIILFSEGGDSNYSLSVQACK